MHCGIEGMPELLSYLVLLLALRCRAENPGIHLGPARLKPTTFTASSTWQWIFASSHNCL